MILKDRDFSDEFEFNTSRSGGAGGQHVNKVSSKVELRFNVMNSKYLTEEEKALILDKLSSKITNEGILQVVCQEERSQMLNREKAVEKFYAMVENALTPKKIRKKSKIPKAVKEKRLKAKKITSEKKASRGKIL